MSKRDRRIALAQNAAILLLSLSALFLFVQTPLFGEFSRLSLPAGLSGLFSGKRVDRTEGALASSAPVFPLRLVQSNEFVRCGLDGLTTDDDVFEDVGTFLGEAIGSAHDAAACSEEELLEALGAPGLYFEFASDLPIEALSLRLGVSVPAMGTLSVRRCLLCLPEGSETAVLYLRTDGGRCLRLATAVSERSLGDYLVTIDGNGADFAHALGEDYSALSPYTVVFSDLSPRQELNAVNALSDLAAEEFLRLCEFNPHTKDRYTDSSGAVVVPEAQRTLRLHPNGTINYLGGRAEAGSIYHVASAAEDHPTRAEALGAAQTLLHTLLQGRTGDASLYIRTLEADAVGYRVTFGYLCEGTPILFADGSCAAEVLIEGSSVTAFTLRLRRYTHASQSCLLLPPTQAAAIGAAEEGAEPTVVYVDTLSELVSAAWVSDSAVAGRGGKA